MDLFQQPHGPRVFPGFPWKHKKQKGDKISIVPKIMALLILLIASFNFIDLTTTFAVKRQRKSELRET